MIEEKKLKESQTRIQQYLSKGIILTKQKQEFTEFFLSNAQKSLTSANALYELSTNPKLQELTGYKDFDGYLWVVNSSYYSMFYLTRALLEQEGIKIKTEASIHAVTFDALINFFYLNGKLQKKLVEDFSESMNEATTILGKQKADKIIEDYYWEKGKIASLTYQTEETVMSAKAKTSLERAKKFYQELQSIIRL